MATVFQDFGFESVAEGQQTIKAADAEKAVQAAQILATATDHMPLTRPRLMAQTRPMARKKVVRKRNWYPILWIVFMCLSQFLIPFGMGWSFTKNNWVGFKSLAVIEISTLVLGCFVYLYYQKRSVFKIIMIFLIMVGLGLAGYIFVAAGIILRTRT